MYLVAPDGETPTQTDVKITEDQTVATAAARVLAASKGKPYVVYKLVAVSYHPHRPPRPE